MPLPISTVFDTRSLGLTTRGARPRVASPTRVPDNSGVTAPGAVNIASTLPISALTIDQVLGGIGTAIDFGTQIGLFGPQVQPGQTIASQVPCPDPRFERDQLGVCVFTGSPGELTVPSAGDVGPFRDVSIGVFGLMSAQPMVIGEIRGRPVLRCPHPGLVLGKDDRCYSKKDLPSKLRKWPPHKCVSSTDRKIKAIKAAGAAAKSLTATFKGSGFKISRNK